MQLIEPVSGTAETFEGLIQEGGESSTASDKRSMEQLLEEVSARR